MNRDIQEKLEQCRDLPSQPHIAHQLLVLSEQPEVDVGQLGELISRDTALTAKILRAANSPLYGYRRKAEKLRDAVMFMGINGAITLALTFTLMRSMSGSKSKSAKYDLLWRRSALSALVATEVGRRIGAKGRERIFLAAILQDIGVFTMLEGEGEGYERLIARCASHADLAPLERATYGATHVEIGAWLLRRWHLPESLCALVESSTRPVAELAARPDAACVALSWRIAEYLLLGSEERELRDEAIREARTLLGDDQATIAALLEAIEAQVPELNRMMSSDIVPASAQDAMLTRARELIMVRQVRMMGEIERMRERISEYEDQAEKLQAIAERDHLTGLLSRSALEEHLTRCYKAAIARGKALSILMVDLDNFRDINARFGHPGGDQAIHSAAALVKQRIGKRGYAGRYGGDEFTVILPDCEADAARDIASAICADIERCRVKAYRGEIRMTVSLGAATMCAQTPPSNAWDLVKAADNALYHAKREGKNRCHSQAVCADG